MIRAVFFDVGNTLIRPYPSVGDIYAEVARKYGMVMDRDALNLSFKRAFLKHGHIPLTDTRAEVGWWRRIVRDTVEALCQPLRFDAFFSDLFETFKEKRVWEIYPDVIPALEALQGAGIRLGVISNWDSRLVPTLGNLGLSDYFSVMAVSALVGSAKPDAGIFEYAMDMLRVTAEEALHVGDSPERDCEGAMRCGMQALLIGRKDGASALTECGTIHSLEGVLSHVL
jgi:putative hydrolase of the HAD superfamily